MPTSRSGAGGGSGSNNNNTNDNNPPPPPPPPPTVEQMMAMQTQFMQGMTHMMTLLQQNMAMNQNQRGNTSTPPPRDRRGEFMKGRPPFFSHSPDPMQAVDWLKAVEKKLLIAQCTDKEKVLYGSGQLQGAAQSWWESYCAAHAAPDTITWDQFKEVFEKHHVSARLVKLKKEFSELKQGSMFVCEFRDKFTELSRYAPKEVEDDEAKQEHFLEGLNDGLSYMLSNVKYANFQEMVDRAIVLENKRRKMEEKKRKANYA